MYSQSKVLSVLTEATGKFKSIEDLARYPDWTLQGANVPATLTVTDVACKEHPELIVALLKGLIKVGRWANEYKRAACAILNKQTYYLDEEDTYEGIRRVDMVPQPVGPQPGVPADQQGLHAQERLHRARLRRVRVGRARVPRDGGEGAPRGGVEEAQHGQAA